MPYRKDVTMQLGPFIGARVDINSGVEKEAALRTVCVGTADAAHQATAIKQLLRCPECLNNDPATYKKAQEVGKGIFTLVEQEEVADIKKDLVGHTNKVINLSVHLAKDVRQLTVQGGSVYYLTPSVPGASQVMDLIRDAMVRHPELAFMGLYSPAGRPNLYEVKLFGDTLVLEERARTESIKIVQQATTPVAEVLQVQMDSLLPALITDFAPETFADQYTARLNALIAEREATSVTVGTTTVTPVAGGLDLTSLMANALADAGVKKAPVKKAAAKKAATPRKRAAKTPAA